MVYLPLCKVADTPFHIQGDKITITIYISSHFSFRVLSQVATMSQAILDAAVVNVNVKHMSIRNDF